MLAFRWYVRRLRTMSAREVVWRASSLLGDAVLWSRLALALPPRPPRGVAAAPPFRVTDVSVGEWADPKTDEHRAWRDRLLRRAARAAAPRLDFLGLEDRDLGDPIDWNRDHSTGTRSPLRFAPLVDYRDHDAVGDAKLVWEPSRHHHLVVLGRAYRATGDLRHASAVVAQLDSWIAQCPFARGMNWRSPLEIAIRLINWVWVLDLIRESGLVGRAFSERLERSVYLHLWEVVRRYSRGSSANNHRIGEAAGVFIASSYFPRLDAGGRWRQGARRILIEEIVAQTHGDGGTREQAVGYHVFALQFFLLSALVARACGDDLGRPYWARLERMFDFLDALVEGGRGLPMVGDADDGYVLDLGAPHDVRELLGIGAVLFRRPDFVALAGGYPEAARWLLGGDSQAEFEALVPARAHVPLVSRALPESGYYLLQGGHRGANDRVSVVFDCGELGFGSIAAHGHADALSFTLRSFGADVLVDPGTYDYFTFPAWRRYFRSTRAHNTLVVDGQDQSVMQGPFLWGARARARCVAWEPAVSGGRVVGEHDGYTRLSDPVVHRRTLTLDAALRTVTVRDDVVAQGDHDIALYFHLTEDAVVSAGPQNCFRVDVPGGRVTVVMDTAVRVETVRGAEDPIGGWVSRGYHVKVPSVTLIARGRSRGPSSFVTRLLIG
jgi:hypothetical protein